MSHCAVMVIGEDFEKQLLPFDENPEDPKFLEFKDCTEEVVSRWEANESHPIEYPREAIDLSASDFQALRDGKIITVGRDVMERSASPFGFNPAQFPFLARAYSEEIVAPLRDKYHMHRDDSDEVGFRAERDKVMPDVFVNVTETMGVVVSETDDLECNKVAVPITYEVGMVEIACIHLQEEFPNIDEFAKAYFGYRKIGDRYGYFYNPNSKWDWFALGGRYTGFFKVKPVSMLFPPNNQFSFGKGELEFLIDLFHNNPDKFEKVIKKYNGKEDDIRSLVISLADTTLVYPSTALLGKLAFDDQPPVRPGRADSLFKRDIDIDAMREEAKIRAEEEYDAFERATRGLEPPERTWNETREAAESIQAARVSFSSHPWVVAIVKAQIIGIFDDPVEYFMVRDGGREAFIQRAIDSTIVCFAMLYEGKWYERGNLGMFGIASNEKGKKAWAEEFMQIFNSVPDDARISIVDCHI